eukprot:TRINITY_DN8300_c0_g1_i1.p2 TRINITY_DN8300_c0_g1~~TRINITY_DN8300_c0_g1_i1.p2  ORF type:complete len:161 (+),score=31.43 TRINITY_DN8300_c0_g1_i1:99-581(+)
MPHSFGYRAATRSKFARPFRRHGPEHLVTYLRNYKIGDYVDVVGNGAIHKGMPHKGFHGKTGIVWNVTPRAVGVVINKRVGHRIMKKKIHVRIEHVQPSKCRSDFLARMKRNDDQTRNAKKGKKAFVQLKRVQGKPLEGHFVSTKAGVETITPQRYSLIM